MPRVKQLTAWVEDQPGILGQVASALGAKRVNIRAFTAAVVEGRGAIRLVVDRPAAARKVLAEHGWQTTDEDVVQVILSDKPGALGEIARKLGAAGINIQYAYTGSAGSGRKVNTFCAVADVDAALKALRLR